MHTLHEGGVGGLLLDVAAIARGAPSVVEVRALSANPIVLPLAIATARSTCEAARVCDLCVAPQMQPTWNLNLEPLTPDEPGAPFCKPNPPPDA